MPRTSDYPDRGLIQSTDIIYIVANDTSYQTTPAALALYIAAPSGGLLGTAAQQNVGVGPNDVVQLDAFGRMPAVDGSALLNLPGLTSHAHTIADVTALQSTLDGKQPLGSYSFTTHGHADATPITAGFESAEDKAKLDGIAVGATANAPNEELRDRQIHTGEQAQSTITGLPAALANKLETSDVGTTAGKIVALDSLARLPAVDASQLLNVPGGGTGGGDVFGPASSVDGYAAIYSGITGKNLIQASGPPVLGSDARLTDARTPTAHGHAVEDVTDLNNILAGKQPAGSYSLTSHGHDIATTSLAGFMAAADRTKLSTIATGATALSIGTTGTTAAAGNHGHADATTALAGFLSAADKVRVNAALLRATGQNQPLVADFHAPGTLADGAFRWEAATSLNAPLTTGGGAAILIWRATGVGVWIAWETGGSLGSNVPEFYLKPHQDRPETGGHGLPG